MPRPRPIRKSAVTGQFVSAEYAESHPSTTFTQQVYEGLPESAALVVQERQRQIDEEGYEPISDVHTHTNEELSTAAACYAMPADCRLSEWGKMNGQTEVPDLWPWAVEHWKPAEDGLLGKAYLEARRKELVKAGALILAELDRLALELQDLEENGEDRG